MAGQRKGGLMATGSSGSSSLVTAGKEKLVRAYMDTHRGQIVAALPSGQSYHRLLAMAAHTIGSRVDLQACSKASLCGAVLEATLLGLEIGGSLGQAHLVPFNDRKTGAVHCQLIIGWQGLVTLAYRACEALVWADTVCEADHWVHRGGLHLVMEHERARGPRGEFVGAYACYQLPDRRTSGLFLNAEEVAKRLAVSRRKGHELAGQDWTEEFRLKTAIRRLLNFLPRSIEDTRSYVSPGMLLARDDARMQGERPDVGQVFAVADVPPPPEDDSEGGTAR